MFDVIICGDNEIKYAADREAEPEKWSARLATIN